MSAVRALAVVDTGAIERNCERLRRDLRGGASLCAVVKGDGYGHGAVEAGRAALAGGAEMLGVAAAAEAAELRGALPDASVLVLGALSPDEVDVALGAGAEVAAWRPEHVELLAARAQDVGVRPRVHVKYDSGMGRLGAREPDVVLQVLDAVAAEDGLELAALWTHFATADERGDDYLGEQLQRFTTVVDRARRSHSDLLIHAANSAATLREPDAHFDMVRCGIAIYGLDPFGEDPASVELDPALELRSYVADVKSFGEGESAGYGRSWRAPAETLVGVLPIGYGDGVRRALSNNAEVLVDGERVPLVGTISMDNITVDLGPNSGVAPGADAVLIGAMDGERILAEDVARAAGTINYEITCGISARVPRKYVRS